MDVGEKIRYLRLKKRWTQKHLAGLLGVDKSTISQYETYMRTPVSYTHLDVYKRQEILPSMGFASVDPTIL